MELVTVERWEDLQPLDMVQEGVFLRSIHYNYLRDWCSVEAGLLFYDETDDGHAFPVWGEQVEVDLTFPMKVARGVPPMRVRT